MEEKDHRSLSITSLILGIISLFAWFLPICGIPIAIIGLVLGAISTNSSKRNMAIAGVVMTIIGLVLGIINAVLGAYLGSLGLIF